MTFPDKANEQEMMQLLRENNAMLKIIIKALSANNNVATNFIVDVLANLTADNIHRK